MTTPIILQSEAAECANCKARGAKAVVAQDGRILSKMWISIHKKQNLSSAMSLVDIQGGGGGVIYTRRDVNELC
jgi:hypothetical protein